MSISIFFRFGSQTAVGMLLAGVLAIPAFGESRKLNSVAVTVPDLGNPFFGQVARGAEQKAKEINSGVKFTALSSNYNVKDQSDQIDNFISSKVDLILLGAADSKEIAPAVRRAKQAGITVVAVDVGAEGGVDATVTSNNRQAGTKAGKYVAERLKGQGQIVVVNGPPVTAVTDRVAGFLEEIKKYPDLKIISQDQNSEGNRDGGHRAMRDILAAFPKIDAVFAINDPSAIGCDLAAKEAQRKEFFIVGVDGSPEIVPFLKDPGSLIEATSAQDPYLMAQEAVSIGNKIMLARQDLTLIPVGLITKENVSRYSGWSK